MGGRLPDLPSSVIESCRGRSLEEACDIIWSYQDSIRRTQSHISTVTATLARAGLYPKKNGAWRHRVNERRGIADHATVDGFTTEQHAKINLFDARLRLMGEGYRQLAVQARQGNLESLVLLYGSTGLRLPMVEAQFIVEGGVRLPWVSDEEAKDYHTNHRLYLRGDLSLCSPASRVSAARIHLGRGARGTRTQPVLAGASAAGQGKSREEE